MEILYDLDFFRIKEQIFKVAPFQKVVFCYDSSTPIEIVEKIIFDNAHQTIFCEYNLENFSSVKDIIDGAKVVICELTDKNFLKLKKDLNDRVCLIDLYYGDFLSLHLVDNIGLLFLLNKGFDYSTEFLLQACSLIEMKFFDILSYQNYNQADNLIDEELRLIDDIKNVKQVDLKHRKYQIAFDKFGSFFDFSTAVDIKICLYVFVVCYRFLFLSIKNNNYVLTDIYKDYHLDFENLNIAYEILNSKRISYVLNNYADTMLEVINKIMFEINKINLKININIKNMLKIIKNKCKINKKDNLLKICYLYGVFNSI